MTATDAAGNVGTDTGVVTVDTTAPAAPVIDPVNETDPITGTAEPGSTVTVTYPDGSTASVVAGPDGTWTVPNPGLNDGDTVTAVTEDPAGNTSGPATAVVDAVAPTVALDDVLTNDSTPALTGTVNDPTATVVVNVDGVDYPAVNMKSTVISSGSLYQVGGVIKNHLIWHSIMSQRIVSADIYVELSRLFL